MFESVVWATVGLSPQRCIRQDATVNAVVWCKYRIYEPEQSPALILWLQLCFLEEIWASAISS